MKNVLITGASGGFGRVVVAKMKELGIYRVFATSRQSLNIENSLLCDVRDKKQIAAVIEQVQPDIVVHLAATFSNNLTENYPVNVKSARYILDLIQSQSLKTRVVLIGSAAEYGIVQPHENPIREDRFLAPISAYGISKAWQTQLMGMYNARGVDVLCARIFNLYGEGISERSYAGQLYNQISAVLVGKQKVITVGDLSDVRDYISTSDATDKLLALISRGEAGKIYHVASGVPIMMREFTYNQLNAYGLDASMIKEDPFLSHLNHYHIPIIVADMTNTNQLYEQ